MYIIFKRIKVLLFTLLSLFLSLQLFSQAETNEWKMHYTYNEFQSKMKKSDIYTMTVVARPCFKLLIILSASNNDEFIIFLNKLQT